MKPEDAKSEVIRYWMEKAYESLESANLQAQEFVNVMSKLLKEMSSESNHFNFL